MRLANAVDSTPGYRLKLGAMGCTIGRNHRGHLRFRLYWEGREWTEGTKAKDDTPENRRLMEAQAILIAAEMRAGTFDYLKWFPRGNRAILFGREVRRQSERTIRQYYEEWKLDKVSPLVKRSRARKYASHFNAHILPFHGDRYLHLYGVTELRELRAHLAEAKKLKLKTIKNIMNATLRALFRDARAENVIEKNPFEDLPKQWWPKTARPAPDPFSEKERDAILEYFAEKYSKKWPRGWVFLYTMFWTGLRPSELTARRVRDFDPRTGKLEIRSSHAEGEEGMPKTAASKRIVELLEPVAARIMEIIPIHARPDDHLFLNQRGRQLDQKEFATRHFWPALTALKLRKRDFYATRHTFISVMLSHGEPAKRLAEYCGTSLAMIEESYGKWIGSGRAFGAAALAASPSLNPSLHSDDQKQSVKKHVVGMVRGGGFEPPPR